MPFTPLKQFGHMLIIAAVLFEVASVWLLSQKPEFVLMWRLVHLTQMLLLIALTWAGRQQLKDQNSSWVTSSNLILAALLFSLVGDFINARLIDLTAIFSPQTVLSIPPFAIAQMLYVTVFWMTFNQPKQARDIGHFKAISLLLWLPVAGFLWSMVFSGDQVTVMLAATLFYTALVVLMGISSTWVWRSWGNAGATVCGGAVLFLTSDAMIGHAMSSGNSPSGFAGHLIWLFYFVAQCLIARLPILGHELVHSSR